MTVSPRLLAIFVAAAALATIAVLPTAGASASASQLATVRVSEGYYPVTGTGPYTSTSEPCGIGVRKRSVNALAALAAATRRGCVSSYRVSDTPSGHYLECVDGRCETTGFYWAIYRNGSLTCEGIDDVPVQPGDEITFSYEAYPTALALATCG